MEVKMIQADFHIHSSFSADSFASMESVVESAIKKNLKHICFTEHLDYDFPASDEYPSEAWLLNIDSYLYELLLCREKYDDKIKIGFGLELGLQKQIIDKVITASNSQPFDYIIASIHVVDGFDTYDPLYFEGKSRKEAVTGYFETILDNIKSFDDYDSLGHMDYIIRTLPEGPKFYNYSDYIDLIDEILKTLIKNNKGLELNTSALIKGYKNPNPDINVIKRFKELGGEIITIGSDSHVPQTLGGEFDKAEEILKAAGFNYYTVFNFRKPEFIRL